MTTIGTINSWGDKPPWKYSRFPPATLKMAKLAGVAMSKSLSIPSEDNEAELQLGGSFQLLCKVLDLVQQILLLVDLPVERQVEVNGTGDIRLSWGRMRK
jgi:hypothetical protein